MYRVLADSQGNVPIADRENRQIRSGVAAGILRVVAGNRIAGFSGDGGLATRASLNFPVPSRWMPFVRSLSRTPATTACAA
jgi:hypothetical protein